MAVTVTALLTDVTLGESADSANWAGTDGNSAEIYRQGSGSEGWIVARNRNETGSFDINANNGSPMDMSGTGVHLFITMRCDVAPFIDYVHFGLESKTGDGAATSGVDYWTVVDNTTVIEWAGEWITIKLDVNSTTKFSTSGTLDLANISVVHITVDNSNSGNIRSIENTYLDAIRFGTGLKITGTVWDWQDVADDDNLNANKYDIVRKVGPGVFEVNGQLQIGDGATTTTPATTNETLFFKDISTSGIEGGPIGKQASGFYKIIVTGSGCTCDFNNMSVFASSVATFIFDADDTGLPDASINWNGGTIIQCSSFLSDGAQDFTNLGFYDCGQIDPAGSDFINFVIDNYTGTAGAILWPGGTTIKNGTIQNSDRGVEITQTTNQTFDNIIFPSNTYDVHLNNGGNDISVSKTNGSDPTNYIATGGGVVTFTGASATVTITVRDIVTNAVIENARVFLQASSGTGPFNYEVSITSITRVTTTATVTQTAHGLSTGDFAHITGANQEEYNGCHQITKLTDNTYTFTVSDSGDSPATGTIIETDALFNTLTNASGVVTDSRVYASDQPLTGWVRFGANPFYKTQPMTAVIVDSAAGFSTTILLIPDA